MLHRLYLLAVLLFTCLTSFGQSEYITVWDLSKSGQSATEIRFAANTSGTVRYAWNEVSPGNASGTGEFVAGLVTIAGLPANAVIELQIEPNELLSFRAASADSERLLDVKQWGTTRWISMTAAFANCNNLNITATDIPNLSLVSNMTQMFVGCESLNGPANIGNWNLSNVTSILGMFQSATLFNQPIGNWNVSKVRNLGGLFFQASAFNQDISRWDVSNVVDMSSVFTFASSFNQPIGNWQTSNVRNMDQLFTSATAFNQPIGNWDVSGVTTMSSMFSNASSFNQDISSWNVSSVTQMRSMFSNASAFNQPLTDWNVRNVTSMLQMFNSARSFDQSLGSWAGKLNPAVNMEGMLSNSGLSVSNYDATLIAFNAEGPTGRTLFATGLKYCSALDSRANLVRSVAQGGKGWAIYGDGYDCAMPVTLVSFSGSKLANGRNSLEWVTADEIDFDRFEIQRSRDARSFETIGIVKGTASQSPGVLGNYRFIDEATEAMHYYRLKMVDTDGSFDFSRVISIQNRPHSDVVGTFYPNPARQETTIDIYSAEKSEWSISTSDVTGRLLQSQKTTLSPGMNRIQLKLPQKGMNIVRFESGSNVEVRRLISTD